MLKNVDLRKLLKSIALPLLVGGIAGFLNMDGMKAFGELNQPPLSPPAWLFPIVWTILYVLMGISFYLISEAESKLKAWEVSWAQPLYYAQLAANFIWPFLFFRLEWYFISLIWLIILWLLVFAMIKEFYKISRTAAYLNIPYLIWLTFAAYLNLGVWWLNR